MSSTNKAKSPTPGPASPADGRPSEPTNLLSGSHWGEQELPLDDDADSTLGSDAESSTASLASSIMKYRTFKGRTYHSDAATDQEYWGPNDEKANEMLDIFHHFQTLLFDGKLHTAPLKDDIENALDVATGTGLWAVDFADEYPKCNVYGTDISPIQPSWVPPNLRFDIDDATKPWTYQEDFFDYVHIRWLTGVIKDWTALYKEAYKCMKPGAWIEHIDGEVNLVCYDGTMPKESAINQWGEIWSEVGRRTGLVFNMVDSGCMENGIEEAGFTNIQVKDYLAPCSPWPEDAKTKELGLWQYVFLVQDIEGFLNYFLGQFMDWSDKEMATYAACLRKEYKDQKIHAYFKWRVVLAQKPLDA
ncbi:S-adenosyl-L-methionine-dependent methyltransferase [Pseudoneurospora amorphoporcata]|uniref:S-adenosyl-L-methionine-dependent methyltransferase n=1 Tax=Pseudoneurospora amorphoporcata TaxID=241081 RepID=A0AAN6NYQ0_9PEZI|nr:S-adenosyl-L-methionine-dependent methyltransferase [Pseudoneurospora amorphoporcata]